MPTHGKTAGFGQPLFRESSTQREALGAIWVTEDGRAYVYAKNGASGLYAGQLTQCAVPSANANKETVAASAAVGDNYVSVTFGGAVTADYYKDGYLWVNDDTGEGSAYRIRTHAAGTTAVKVYLMDGEEVRDAITAGAGTVSAIKHPQDGVIICPTTLTSGPAGVPPIDVTASYYFWNQVKGPAAVLTDGTVAIGESVSPSNGTAGSVEATVYATTFDVSVGVVLGLNATTEYSLIQLAIPGY